jgi:hypothetical protein
MKTPILIIAAMPAALLGSAFGEEPSPSPPIDACNYSSWNPEAYCFYGEKAKIVDKLSNLSTAKLSERRVYLQITQGESSGDVKLYERQKNGTFTVTEWTTPDTSHLLTEFDKVIIANKGVNCVGEQIKSLLGKELKQGKVSEGVAPPESFKAAFAHSVNAAKGAFIRRFAKDLTTLGVDFIGHSCGTASCNRAYSMSAFLVLLLFIILFCA